MWVYSPPIALFCGESNLAWKHYKECFDWKSASCGLGSYSLRKRLLQNMKWSAQRRFSFAVAALTVYAIFRRVIHFASRKFSTVNLFKKRMLRDAATPWKIWKKNTTKINKTEWKQSTKKSIKNHQRWHHTLEHKLQLWYVSLIYFHCVIWQRVSIWNSLLLDEVLNSKCLSLTQPDPPHELQLECITRLSDVKSTLNANNVATQWKSVRK